MTEWIQTTLGALCERGGGDIQTGPFGSQLHASDYVPAGIPTVMPVNIGDNRIDSNGIARITQGDADRLARYRLVTGDIVYSRRGDVERRALVREEDSGWICGTGCLRIRFGRDPGCDPRFVSYLLGAEEVRKWIVRHAVGATMLNLNTSILSAVPLTVPDLHTQRAIAEVLGALDDKIAANTRLVHTIDNFSEAEFRVLQCSATSASTIGDILTLEYGKSLPASQRVPGHVAVYGSGGIVGNHNAELRDGPGVVVGRKGTAGTVHWAGGPHFPIDTTFYAVPNPEHATDIFCYFALKSLPLGEMNSDSAVPGLNRAEAHALPVRMPSMDMIVEFSDRANALFDLKSQHERENQSLAATRDALLPELMSGRLRVSDAEAVVEAAL